MILLERSRIVEGLVDEGAEVPAVEEFVRGFAGGVVAAGQHSGLVADAQLVEAAQDLEGELAEEGEVVGGVDDEGSAVAPGGGLAKALHIVDRADGSPESIEPLLGQADRFKGGADVAGALAGPDHISERGGRVIEGADL